MKQNAAAKIRTALQHWESQPERQSGLSIRAAFRAFAPNFDNSSFHMEPLAVEMLVKRMFHIVMMKFKDMAADIADRKRCHAMA